MHDRVAQVGTSGLFARRQSQLPSIGAHTVGGVDSLACLQRRASRGTCVPGAHDYPNLALFEQEPLERLAADGQLAAYRHRGFWQPMDTLRDKRHLEELWESGRAPWKTW